MNKIIRLHLYFPERNQTKKMQMAFTGQVEFEKL